MKQEDKQPDPDEITENYSFGYQSSTGLTASFESHTIQSVLSNFLTFLQTLGFSYVGKITLESKDGTKTWTT
jgi:hypothetical protein